MNRVRSGFTLVELMVVVSVISVLITLMVPALSKTQEAAHSIKCRSNLRQMAIAAAVYVEDHNGRYPKAQEGGNITWEISRVTVSGVDRLVPGELWEGHGTIEIQQCPSYHGPDNWVFDSPYSGYNYNTSYIGHGMGEDISEPVRESQIRNPKETALFGDGGWSNGANKFMRAPWPNPADVSFTDRHSGTQAFRHNHTTNVAFCDGHILSLSEIFTDTNAAAQAQIVDGTGFLSSDNSLYDLR